MSTTATTPRDLCTLSHLSVVSGQPVSVLAAAMRELNMQPCETRNGLPWIDAEQSQQIAQYLNEQKR